MKTKRKIIPEFYGIFKCIAGSCPDTCCKDWDIVIDDESLEFYGRVGGDFGNKLKSSIRTDEDGDNVFVMKNGLCPFLCPDKLCEIQIEFGEEHICETCRDFPRITQDYTEFTEYTLSAACPEACRIMLDKENNFDCIKDFEVIRDNNGYSGDLMNFLLKARGLTADIFKTAGEPFEEQMKKCLLFTDYIQRLIDYDIFKIEKLREFRYTPKESDRRERSFVFEMHRRLDIMDKAWLDNVLSSSEQTPDSSAESDGEFRRLALYYIYRYYLNAIDSYDVITTAKLIYCAYVVCSAMIKKLGAEKDSGKRVLVFQKYSKEVEHSFENKAFLTDEFEINPDFWTDNLISTL